MTAGVPLFVEYCEAVAAEIDVRRRWIGEQGRRKSFCFCELAERQVTTESSCEPSVDGRLWLLPACQLQSSASASGPSAIASRSGRLAAPCHRDHRVRVGVENLAPDELRRALCAAINHSFEFGPLNYFKSWDDRGAARGCREAAPGRDFTESRRSTLF